MIYNLPETKIEESFEALSFKFPFEITAGNFWFKLYSSGGKEIDYTEHLEIDSSDKTKLRILTHDLTIGVGHYNYKIILRVNGAKKIYLKGNWEVVNG